MKKKVLAVVSACMLVLLAACGGAEEKTDKDDKSDVKVTSEVNSDTKQDDKQDNADSEPVVEGPAVYTAKQEILDAEWHSGMLQVNDKLIQLPMSLSEFVAMGFDYEINSGSTKKDYLFANGEAISYTLLLDGEEICYLSCWQDSEERLATLEEVNPKVGSIEHLPIKKTKLTFFLPGGVTMGDTMQEVEEKLGEPSELLTSQYSFSYRYGYMYGYDVSNQSEVGVRMGIEREGLSVTSFKIARNIVMPKYEEFSANTMEIVKNRQSDEMHEVQFFFPAEHLYTGNTTSDANADTIFEKDGVFYRVNVHFNGTLQRYFNEYELQRAGTLLYEATDENGVSRYVYDSGVIYCFKSPSVMTIRVDMTPLFNTDADVNGFYQEYLIELGKSIQY